MIKQTSAPRAPFLLAASAASGMQVTGTTNETALATIAVPAGAMGTGGALLIRTTWSSTSSANNKTIRIRLGGIAGTQFMFLALTSSQNCHDQRVIRNRGAANSQIASFSLTANSGGFGTTGSALVTGSVNTAVAQDLVLSAQLALGTETATLESYEVWLQP